MCIRGTVRLSVVALLGIEITIISLTSAASAATYPDGPRAEGSMYDSRPGVWYDGPETWQPGPAEAGWRFDEAEEYDFNERDIEYQLPPEMYGDPGWPFDRPEWETFRPYTHHDRTDPRREVKAQARKRAAAAKARRSHAHAKAAETPRTQRQAPHRRPLVDLSRVLPRQASVQMSHFSATTLLRKAGLHVHSSGNCTSKHRHTCTSLESVRAGTIADVLTLKQRSGCPITVTGGTERGHAPGRYSHGNGYKLDISHNSCIDRYITANARKAGRRGDGSALYRDSSGTIYANEGTHWDILFR